MARITPNENANSQTERKERAEKLTAGLKYCVILGYFFETSYGNKKLQVAYAVIDDGGCDPTEVGIIHIDSLLIRDTVAWKHQLWAAGCGYTEPYDNEDHADLNKIVLGCRVIGCEFKERKYTGRDGNEKTVLEIDRWNKVAGSEADELLGRAGIDKLISSCEQSFAKILDYRERRGDQIERAKMAATAGGSDNPHADFDDYVSDNGGDEIPF